jgi:cell division protein FtsZ
MFELVDSAPQSAVIRVIGVGGGGGNAVQHMVKHDVAGVDFICANTDAQALHSLDAKTLLQLGAGITKGLGAGANPEGCRHGLHHGGHGRRYGYRRCAHRRGDRAQS